jgi:hypothetical protein
LAAIAKRVLAAAGERRLGIIAAEFDALLELERLLRVDRRRPFCTGVRYLTQQFPRDVNCLTQQQRMAWLVTCSTRRDERDTRNTMGTVIRFPFERVRSRPTGLGRHESASIIILPVVRIERWGTSSQLKPPAAGKKSPGLRPRARTSE